MASKSALLRNIRPSGGLFTENILLRLRDNPNQLKIGKIDSFLEEDTKEERKKLTEKKQIIFDWCIQKWDEISPNIEEWSIEDLAKKWLIPLFTLFDHEIEDFEINKENLDEDSILKEFRFSYQSRDHRDPFFHYVSVNEDFDSKIDRNPQKKSHHNVCQQFINFNSEIKWLFLSNGRILRILTKYYHSYSKGYLEFDLENIFANRDEREFDTLYSIIHSSRFNSKDEDGTFLIDKFQKDSITEGVKIGDTLRDNVENALELLGNELIQQNLDKIDVDKIDVNEFYAELLRIIYRIIFILYAEQRDMLPGAGSLYFEQFSLSSLRIRAEKPIKAEKNYDLWHKMLITFNLIRDGNSLLGVNSYNGSLYKEDNLRIILKNGMKISNDIVLQVIRLLTTSANHKVRQRINFLEVSEEEIGAIYESLLDFRPYISSTSQFQLIEGTERKSTGSYYTPKVLIDILIRTTLQPLIEDRLIKAGDDEHARESAILDLKVCDPACGGGTFLLSALDYLGKKLAEVRTSSDSPLEDDLREARRDVLQHCIYGVDMNPLAVELAKISLWLRACVKDKPLNFLDNHIKCGNSLVGLGQKIEIKSIRSEAFKAISGNKEIGIPRENTKLQNQARNNIKKEIKERKKEGKTTMITSFFTDKRTADVCSIKFQEIINMLENSPEKIIEKEIKYYELRKNENYQQALNEANIWTSTFFWSFEGNTLGEIPRYTTIEQLRDKIADPELNRLMEKINDLAKKNKFFHWYIEFPEIFSSKKGGFDCLLGNPPWERIKITDKEFFEGIVPSIVEAKSSLERYNLMKKEFKKHPDLFEEYKNVNIQSQKIAHFIKNSNFYNYSAVGDINTYLLFAERFISLLTLTGRAGIIVPTGIATDYYSQKLFNYIVDNHQLVSLFDFENKKRFFPDIHGSFRFSLLTLGGKKLNIENMDFGFFLHNIEDFFNENRKFNLKIADFEVLNPNTKTCPVFKVKKDFKITMHAYKIFPILLDKNKNKNIWNVEMRQGLIHLTEDSKKNILKSLNDIEINFEDFFLLYEGRMINIYDHRAASIDFREKAAKRTAITKKTTPEQHKNIKYTVIPRYYIHKDIIENRKPKGYLYNWILAFRDVTATTNERTMIACILPNLAVSYSLRAVFITKFPPKYIALLLANLNSLCYDYLVRQKTTGTHLSNFIFYQVPIIPSEYYKQDLIDLIIPRVIQLSFTSYDLKKFAEDCGYNGTPYKWDIEERNSLRAELDALYAHLYKYSKTELEYIIDSFTVTKKYDMNRYNEFRTKRLILNAFDKFSEQKELFE